MTKAQFTSILYSRFTLPLLLLAGFFVFYWNAAQQLKKSPVFVRDDVFFRADTSRALKDITGGRDMEHMHTTGHPNIVLLHAPLGTAMRAWMAWRTPGTKRSETARRASIVLTSAAGAGTVVMFYLLLLANGVTRGRALLFSGVLGFSAVQMFYASIPETYMFSALGITAVAFLASRRDLGDAWWHAAAVYAWSALTTTIALVGIWSLARYWRWPMVKRLAKVMAITVAVTVALSLIQSVVYPKSAIFFLPSSVERESGWLYWQRLSMPVETTWSLLQHMWMLNIVAPEPVVTEVFGKQMASIQAGSWAMMAPSMPLLAVWLCLLAGALTSLRHRSFYTAPVLAAMGTMVFNFCFFFIFGHDRMLYAALWTSTAVFLAAAGLDALLKRKPQLAKPATCLLVILIAGEVWHNWHFLGKLAALVTV